MHYLPPGWVASSASTGIRKRELLYYEEPERQVKPIVDNALNDPSQTFNRMYAEMGRPSIPPEHLLKSCLLIALYSIRSERQFCERFHYDLLFKWFLGLNIMDTAFDALTFSKNKQRLLEHRVAREFPKDGDDAMEAGYPVRWWWTGNGNNL